MNAAEYARHRGVDESTVRQAVRDGRIADAIAASGDIDAAAADRLWAANTSRGNRAADKPSPTLAAARRRKAEASIAVLTDEVEAMRASLVTPDDADRIIAEQMGPVFAGLRAIAAKAARAAAGLPPADAERAIAETVRDAMAAVSGGSSDPPMKAATPKRNSLRTKTAAEVEAVRTELLAERMELRRAAARGELVDVETVVADFERRIAALRSALLMLPSRVRSGDEASLRRRIEAELEDAIAEMERRP